MLVAIGVLVLVVIFMASKPMPGDQKQEGSALPNPSPIPATGTSGIPSPATSIVMGKGRAYGGTPLLGTNAGKLAMDTNMPLPETTWRGNPPLPSRSVISSAPQSVPLQAKELITGAKSVIPFAGTSFSSQGLRKL